MQYSRYISLPLVFATSCQIIPIIANANESPIASKEISISELNNEVENLERIPRESTSEKISEESIELERINKNTNTNLAKQLPTTITDTPKITKEQSIEYFSKNPADLEKVLGMLILRTDAEHLKELLPLYDKVANKDQSITDWGNAIILAKSGQLDKAIVEYRKINAKLPDVKVLRFQMAMALFYNGQYEAAKSEFEILRSNANKEDAKEINNYLDTINSKNSWDLYGTVSYLDDDNLNNSPEIGTSFTAADGGKLIYSNPHESGRGFDYSLSADKRQYFDNKSFASFGLNGYGQYYWDNNKYNDITTTANIGVGYQNSITNFEMSPFYSKHWFAGGSKGSGKLSDYSSTTGARVSLSQWLTPKLSYQGLVKYSDTDYIEDYSHNDSHDQLYSNTLVYFPNSRQNLSLGLDYSIRNAKTASKSSDRKGVRVNWGQSWPKGYSTKLNFGYGKRNYDAENFLGIKLKNEEYSTGLTVWNRGFSVLGLTPKLHLNYFKVDSNSPFEKYHKNNTSIDFTKTF